MQELLKQLKNSLEEASAKPADFDNMLSSIVEFEELAKSVNVQVNAYKDDVKYFRQHLLDTYGSNPSDSLYADIFVELAYVFEYLERITKVVQGHGYVDHIKKVKAELEQTLTNRTLRDF